MSLRLKLLLVALSTLTLPWAGWQFVRQTEALLRQGQEQTLLASASALARALVALDVEVPAAEDVLYVHARADTLRIDGYAGDWQAFKPHAQDLGDDSGRLRVMLASDAQWLYLFASVRDATRTRADARDPAGVGADRLEIELLRGSERRRYRIASAAPGSVDAPTIDGDGAFPERLLGEWQEDGSGYSIELRIARVFAPERIGFTLFDATTPTPLVVTPRRLLGYSDDAARVLARLAPEHTRLRMLSADGWLVASGGTLDAAPAEAGSDGVFADLVYRWLLAPTAIDSADAPGFDGDDSVRLADGALRRALDGQPATRWRSSDDGGVQLAVAVPLGGERGPRGALVLEQANPTVPALAHRALLSLLGASLVALGVSAALLLLFGGLLSLRIRRLRDATERATGAGGRLTGRLPLLDSRDELGDLARSFARLFDEIDGYTGYLGTLASKLSHELNTPLAIVRSSLDNLDHHELPPGAHAYLERARDGAARLGGIVRAMSESSRVERAIGSAEAEDFDLRALVVGCAEGYRALAGTRALVLDAPAQALPFHGAPDLVAQALDKLFDNARSFTPNDGTIRLELTHVDEAVRIVMSNDGPLLPPAMHDRLFDTLVSVRDAGARLPGEAPHLGLGLTVVRLVAELHRGTAQARNRDDASGVEFILDLRGMPRRRLTGSDADG